MSQIRSLNSSVSISWITEHSRFDSRRGQVVPSFFRVSRPALEPTQPLISWPAGAKKLGLKGAIPSHLNRAILLCDVIPDGKTEKNFAVLTGNSVGLKTVLSSRLSHRELRSSLKDSHTHIQFSFSFSFLKQLNCTV